VTTSGRQYTEYQPLGALRPWILSYWRFATGAVAAGDPPHTVWPDGCTSLALLPIPTPGPRVFLTGPRLTAVQTPVHPNSEVWGVRLWPDVAAQVLGCAAPELRDRAGPADAAITAWAQPLVAGLERCADESARVAALDAALLGLHARWHAPDGAVRAAVTHITARGGDVAMPALAAHCGIGLRQLQRRFRLATGLTLREWARIRRLRESLALRLRTEAGWSTIAAASGFADHAHLTREYQSLVGIAPTHVADSLQRIAHVNVRP
jgi:AraC-like DNA-binding protein